MTWTVSTSSFDQAKIRGLPLAVTHPITGRSCLKYHERWSQERTRFDPTIVELENGDQNICNVLEALLHDGRISYWHTWGEGDILPNDNLSMLHTRSSFQVGIDRELWRIHSNEAHTNRRDSWNFRRQGTLINPNENR